MPRQVRLPCPWLGDDTGADAGGRARRGGGRVVDPGALKLRIGDVMAGLGMAARARAELLVRRVVERPGVFGVLIVS